LVSGLIKPEARMGNDIARQFTHLPAAEAAEVIARHIERFWDPRMRRELEALVAAGDDSLDPLVVDAAGLLAGYDSPSGPVA
jgi:formate dehydrogenase subunit delta